MGKRWTLLGALALQAGCSVGGTTETTPSSSITGRTTTTTSVAAPTTAPTTIQKIASITTIVMPAATMTRSGIRYALRERLAQRRIAHIRMPTEATR